MKTTLRAIGNSRGVLLPAAILAATDIRNEVELTVEGGRIILSPPTRPRQRWFEGCVEESAASDWDALPGVEAGNDAEWAW